MAKRKQSATVALPMRMKEPLRAALEKAAKTRGVSMNAEAVKRLEMSFHNQSLVNEVLEAMFGKPLAAILLVVGRVMEDAGRNSAFMATRKLKDADNWLDNPYGFDQAAQAVHRVIEVLRPEGDATPPNIQISDASITGPHTDELREFTLKHGGVAWANGILDAIQGQGATADQRDWAEPIREMLGPIVDRINWRETENEG